MPDREKVIKALEYCVLSDDCRPCEYRMEFDDTGCQIMKDTLAMLNEQQDEIYALRVELASSNELAEGYAELLKEQVPIVRCISCAFYRSDGECALHNGRWKPEGFCSWAIRKKGSVK